MSLIATTVDNAIVDPLIKLFLCPADMQPLDITQAYPWPPGGGISSLSSFAMAFCACKEYL